MRNTINNSLKDINKFFKVGQEEQDLIEAKIAENIKTISDFSLLQNAIKKNTNNNKSSLLFANWLLKYNSHITAKDVATENLEKLVGMSLKSESEFVRLEAINILQNQEQFKEHFSELLEKMKEADKSDKVKAALETI